jgi:hypothetical protein
VHLAESIEITDILVNSRSQPTVHHIVVLGDARKARSFNALCYLLVIHAEPACQKFAAAALADFYLCETKLAELKVKPFIRDLLFDHADDRGSGSDYDHHEYEEEMREAVECWASHVERLVSPEGAVRLR